MAPRRKTKGQHARGRFSTIHSDAAGIDVGSRFHVVAVAPDRDAEPVRTFQSF
ncbi:MAG: IS110 family transposase, partial [Candidatus Tectomicrobia bacterium]|nr:IS110 family transposase [Candidatus Tectomicrobia bacterium]